MTHEDKVNFLKIGLAMQNVAITNDMADRVVRTYETVLEKGENLSLKDMASIAALFIEVPAVYDRLASECGFNNRAKNILREYFSIPWQTVRLADIAKLSRSQLMKMKSMGRGTVANISMVLSQNGYSLASDQK